MRTQVRIAIGFLFLSVALVLLSSQEGGRAEFSPHTLEYRTQRERTVFAIGIPIYRSSYRRYEHPLVEVLVEEGFVTPARVDADRWEAIFHWNEAWRDGHGFLYDIFVRHRDDVIVWSQNNRACAAIYWSEGFRLLRSDDPRENMAGQYILVDCWGIVEPDEMRTRMQRLKDEVAALHSL